MFLAPSRMDSSYDLSNSSKSCSLGTHIPYTPQHHSGTCSTATTTEHCGNFSAKMTVTSTGARLYLSDINVSLTIPEGAIAKGHKEDIFLAVLQDDRHRPKLSGTCSVFVCVCVYCKLKCFLFVDITIKQLLNRKNEL